MITAPEAIEQLVAVGVDRVSLNNEQPFKTKISFAETIEGRAAELISHQMRRIQEILEANNAYLERARTAEGVKAKLQSRIDMLLSGTRAVIDGREADHAAHNAQFEMNLITFRSMLATMQNIDRHEIEDAGWSMTSASWAEFQQNPWQYFICTGDQCRNAIMRVVLERNQISATDSDEQKKLSAEMAVAWFNEPLRETDIKRLMAENAELQKATGMYADANSKLIKDLESAEKERDELRVENGIRDDCMQKLAHECGKLLLRADAAEAALSEAVKEVDLTSATIGEVDIARLKEIASQSSADVCVVDHIASNASSSDLSALVPEHCNGTALAFDPGVLHVNKDGSGYIAVNEEDFVLEDDRSEGPDGPEGSIHWIVHLDASEIVALRDFLNGKAGSHVTSALATDVAVTPLLLADALDAFWNASISNARQEGDSTTIFTIGAIASGFAAVATHLREGAQS